MTELVDALLTAPVGVALLGRLEAKYLAVPFPRPTRGNSSIGVAFLANGSAEPLRESQPWPWDVPDGTSEGSVAAAVADVQSMSIGALLSLAVEAGYRSAGPWSGSSEQELCFAYRDAPARVAIAEAVAARWGEIGRVGEQQWWHTNHRAKGWFAERRLVNLDRVYGNGEFSFGGVWTCTDPLPEAHHWLVSAWELDDDPISRWRMPINEDARVYEIDGPQDWVALVERFPQVPSRPHMGWELPGPNKLAAPQLVALSGGRAARLSLDHQVLPDWTRVAADYDGVHLTWRGWLTTEGYVSDTSDGGVTMLRYWFSERTLWLNDVCGEPEPLPGPVFDEALLAADVTTDKTRRDQDRAVLRAMLGR